VRTEGAPAAVGPYAQAVRAAGWVWVSGQIGLDPASGRLVDGGVAAETRRALSNLRAIVEAAGSGLDRIVRATVYLVDLADYDVVNRIYAEQFVDEPPARVCVQVAALPKGARVEIDAVALS
jgi:2-iminobutanoate/2-iminopropanoate deaminase